MIKSNLANFFIENRDYIEKYSSELEKIEVIEYEDEEEL